MKKSGTGGRTVRPQVLRLPGKRRSFLETRRFAQGVKARIPALTVTGARHGPLAVIMAGQHGRELNGIVAIERVFNGLRPAAMSGTVVFLPVMNPLAIRMRRQEYPIEETRYRPTGVSQELFNMNRTWPGSPPRDAYAAEVTAAAWETYVRHADVVLDLHGWSGCSLCLAWSHKRHLRLLREYGFPWHLVEEEPPKRDTGMIEGAAFAAGNPYVVTELVPQNTIDNASVGYAVRSMGNLLKSAGILKGKPVRPAVQYEFAASHVETPLTTSAEGVLVCHVAKGDWVRKGQTVARVLSLETLDTTWQFRAPHDALVYNIGSGLSWGEDFQDSAVVYPGQTVGLLKKPTRILRNS
jgi:uncharacterized protein